LRQDEAPTSSTVIFAATSEGNTGQFYCAHTCGSRTVRAVLDALPAHAVAHAQARHFSHRKAGLGPERMSSLARLPGLFSFNDKLPQ